MGFSGVEGMAEYPQQLLSSKDQCWQTPTWFLTLVRQVAAIALDPATAPNNPTGARRFYTEEDNGLLLPWPKTGLVFVNPPYGRHLSGPVCPVKPITRKDKKTGAVWVEGFGTGWAEKMASHDGEGLYRTPARPDTVWWKRMHSGCDWACLWSSKTLGARINFVNAHGGKVNGSTFPNCIFYKGPNKAKFAEVFGPHGTLVPGAAELERLLAL